MLGVETKRNNELIVRSPETLLVHEILWNPFSARRQIRIDQSHLPERVSFAGGDVDDISKSLSSARFGRELVENPGRISSVVFRAYKRVSLLKLIKQRLQLIDGRKTVNDNLVFLFGAFDQFLLPVFSAQSVVLLKYI